MKKVLLLLSCFITLQSYSQRLHLSTGGFTPDANVGQINDFPFWTQVQHGGKTYCIIQFNETPSSDERAIIESATGIQFLNYIPEAAFAAVVPSGFNVNTLSSYNVRAVMPYSANYKLSPKLLEKPYPSWMTNGNTITVLLDFHQNISQSQAASLLLNTSASFQSWKNTRTAIISTTEADLATLVTYPWVRYIHMISAPTVVENLQSTTNHRINTINNEYKSGIHFDGTGVSVAEGDDGTVGPHIDFKGRLFDHTTSNGGTHADHVGGIIAGGGNFDPTTSGNARGADLHVYNNYNNLSDAPTDYDNFGVRITSNSLGQGCNAGYNSDAQDADILIRSKPSLMSVHSAGNSGGGSCGGVPQGYYTITGGYKAGKNVLAVGNLTKADNIAGSSSRGPAEDGRIKPDICAVGTNVYSTLPDNTYDSFSGTSMACPGVAGTLASLWQAYRSLNGGADPLSEYMKAVVLNTADDLGNEGPDFIYGFGRINARRAYDAMKNNRTFIDSVNNGGNKNHIINVPANTQQIKILVYWHDVEGTPGSSVPLVNNINMRLFDPAFTIYNPWVLDHTPNVAALSALPIRKKDDLNNVEQVTLDNPPAGNYIINVRGQSIPFGPQRYVVSYEFLTDSVVLTYPTGGEAFENGVEERVRWDAHGNTTPFTLEYSSDEGASWTVVNNNIPADERYFDVTPPSTLNTGRMLMRISRGGISDVSDTLFTVFGVPQNLTVDTACENTFHLRWDAVAGANKYIIYQLGAKYMDSIGSSLTNDYLITSGVNMTDTFYFAVAAWDTTNNAKGRRTIAFMKLPGEINCLDDLYNVETILPFKSEYNCFVTTTLPIKVKLKNIGPRVMGNIPINYQINANPVVTENIPGPIQIGDSLEYTFTTLASFFTPGTYTVTTWLSKYSDINKSNDTSSNMLSVLNPVTLTAPLTENFEGTVFPPNGWRILNPDNSVKWQKTLCLNGSVLGNTYATYMDFFNYTGKNQIDELETIQVDLTNVVNDSVILAFDVAHAYGPSEQDTLSVLVSGNCTQTFAPTSYKKWGTSLATVGMMTNIFSPTLTSQWRNDKVDLSAYKGQKIFLRFRGVNNKGNNLFVDNINIQLKDAWPLGLPQLDDNIIKVYPNPSFGNYTIEIIGTESEQVDYQVSNVSGQTIQQGVYSIQAGLNRQQISLTEMANGIYFLELNTKQGSQRIKLIKQ